MSLESFRTELNKATEELSPQEAETTVQEAPQSQPQSQPQPPVHQEPTTQSSQSNSEPLPWERDPHDNPPQPETSTITAGVTINGDIEAKCSLDMRGTVKGNITVDGKLDITGAVEGNSKAQQIVTSNAQITGNLRSEGNVVIGNGSVIRGNVSANEVVINGAIKGDIDVRGLVILNETAIVAGSIKSKSVQIKPGAAFEGQCTQCYAETTPSSFFKDDKKEVVVKEKREVKEEKNKGTKLEEGEVAWSPQP